MANKIVEEKFVREADEPDSRQISDNSLSDQNKRPSGFENLFDVKVVVSVAGAFAFLLGWIYNIAFFSVLNYDYMDLLTVNDYVLSTLSALPPLLFTGAISFLIGTISAKIQRAAATPYRVASRFTSNPSTIATFAWIAFLLVSSVPGLISYGFRGYWESLMFVGMGVAASTLVFSVVLRIDIIYILRGWLLSVGIWLFFLIGANGAADAKNYLKGGLETAVYSTTHEKTYLVRALTAGAIVIHPNLTELAFIPKERIQYFSTVAKVNRIFDPKYWLRELRR